MASRMRSKGSCWICDREFAKSSMTRHVGSCREKHGGPQPWLHLVVEGAHARMYWMHLEAKLSARLSDLDGFLRLQWLECCGHLSSFRIGQTDYESHHESGWSDALSMKYALRDVLAPGTSFRHVYDFGSSTELTIKVVSERPGPRDRDPIRIVALNQPPAFKCSYCDTTAVTICSECDCNGIGQLCEACSANHECGSEMYLPMVNSPRAGVCGYTGSPW